MNILQTEQITREKWLNLFRRRFRHNGREGDWLFASRRADPAVPATGFDAVLIVPLLLGGDGPPRLVVTREYRVPLGDYEYGFPAGLIGPGESIEETARRELKEETGLDLVEVRKVSPPTYSSSGMTDEAVVMVFATARGDPGARQCLEESEVIEVLLLDHAQVCALCDSGARVNGRAWPVFYMYQQLGRLG